MNQTPARIAVVALLVAASAAVASGAITIDRIDPGGAPSGAEQQVTLTGKDFADPEELWFEEGRIEVVSLEPVDATHVKAVLRVPADCPAGPHRFRLRTKRGLSELRTFRVGGLSQISEAEPNDTATVSDPPPSPREGRTIRGVVKGEDVDSFPVRLAAGERLSLAIDAIRLDQEMFDPCLEIVDDRGFVIASCDDHPLMGQDAMLALTAPADGTYTVRVRESTYGGSEGSLYLLHVGTFPVPHVAWPPGGRAGTETDVEWLGDPAGPFRTRLRIPGAVGQTGLVEERPQRDGVAAVVGVPLRVSAGDPVLDAEPNSEPGEANRLTAPGAFAGRLEREEDVDWVRVEAPKGSQWRVRGWGRRLGSAIDLVLGVHRDDAKRERLTGNDDADGPDAEVKVTTPEQGSFLVRVSDHQRRGGERFVYWLDIEPVVPQVTVSVPPGRSNSQERLVAQVPQGNRTALVFNAARDACDDPVRLAFHNLPAGVRVVAQDVAAPLTGTVAVFESDAAAPPAVRAVDVAVEVRGEGADSPKRVGGLRQVTELVFGQPNNAIYRTSVSDRLPVAVVAPAAIAVDVDPPAVPLARRGSLELRVKIRRSEGFTGKVRLGFPFKPPGIGAPATVDVDTDVSEAVYSINATADAAVGDRRVVVTATVKDKDAPEAWVSSLPITVRVIEPPIEIAAEKATTEQGREAKLVCRITKPGGFEGVAKVKLMGLPAKLEAPELDLKADATEIVFPIAVPTDAPPGRHDNIFCQVRVPQGEEWIVFNGPSTQLRIDKPLRQKESGQQPRGNESGHPPRGKESGQQPRAKESGSPPGNDSQPAAAAAAIPGPAPGKDGG